MENSSAKSVTTDSSAPTPVEPVVTGSTHRDARQREHR